MRIKNILSIAAFSTAFIVSTAFAGLFIDKSPIQTIVVSEPTHYSKPTSCFKNRNKGATAERISGLLRQDISNGRDRDRELYRIDETYSSPYVSSSFAAYSNIITDYADESGRMDDDRLPQEFQTAWRAHMEAWRNYADFLDKMENSASRTALGKESFENRRAALDTNIRLTWYQVLHIADKYGAEID